MAGLLTWPTYGTWFASRRRGWIDRDRDVAPAAVPEPARHAGDDRRNRPWPAARLDGPQRELVVRDLGRLAALRGFALHMVVAAADHVHVLLTPQPDCVIERLVQLVKGSLSRTLTIAAGDEPITAPGGRPLAHHKWWSRQYSFLPITDREILDRVIESLADHETGGATVWRAPGWPDGTISSAP